MRVYTALYIHSYMPTGKTGINKVARREGGPLVNDIQNPKKVNLSAAWQRHRGHRWDEAHSTKRETVVVKLLLHRAQQTSSRRCQGRCLATFCRSVLKQALIVAGVCRAMDVLCCAGNPSWQESASLLQVGGQRRETALRLKISPSHL